MKIKLMIALLFGSLVVGCSHAPKSGPVDSSRVPAHFSNPDKAWPLSFYPGFDKLSENVIKGLYSFNPATDTLKTEIVEKRDDNGATREMWQVTLKRKAKDGVYNSLFSVEIIKHSSAGEGESNVACVFVHSGTKNLDGSKFCNN